LSGALQEHYGYISDPVRTDRFRQAIVQAIRPGDVVVDLGCGFGILGLMCLRAGAARVWGIDRTEAIEIARETAARAGLGDRYHCLREHSFRAELPELADVIICDHVGFFGFDYGIIAALGDARRRFLKPGGKVIPGTISLKIAGITSDDCRRSADAWADASIPAEFHWLREYGTNSKHPHDFEAADLATDSGDLLTINLDGECPDSMEGQIDLVATRDGAIDGVGGWFECELVPGVSMSNSPLDPDRIRREQAFFPFDRGLDAMTGDRICTTMNVRHDPGIIGWRSENVRTGEIRNQSTWRSQILSEADFIPASVRVPKLSRAGIAAQVVAGFIDGKRTAREIEDAVALEYPSLLLSEAEVRSFVRSELARVAG